MFKFFLSILGEGVEKREPFYTVGGNVNWYSQYGEQYGDSFKNQKIQEPYDTAIPLLGIYPEKNMVQKDRSTPLFIAALFTIAKSWKQLKCLLTDEWTRRCDLYTQWNITQPLKRMK